MKRLKFGRAPSPKFQRRENESGWRAYRRSRTLAHRASKRARKIYLRRARGGAMPDPDAAEHRAILERLTLQPVGAMERRCVLIGGA